MFKNNQMSEETAIMQSAWEIKPGPLTRHFTRTTLVAHHTTSCPSLPYKCETEVTSIYTKETKVKKKKLNLTLTPR